MLSSDELCRHPAAFPALTGTTRAEFDALRRRFESAEQLARTAARTTVDGQRRRRAPEPDAPSATARPADS